MAFSERPCAGEADLALIADLLRVAPDTTRHLIDMPWRLASLVEQPPENARLWLDANGAALGFAAWQYYWAALDYVVRPGPQQRTVEDAIFAWAPKRFRELDRERGKPLPYWVEARDDDTARLATAERFGYTLDDDYGNVHMQHSLTEQIPAPQLPTGFTLRPLAGEREAEAYAALHRAAFESASMTTAWRLQTLRAPQYLADLDLVVVAPNGALVGFCVGWLDRERRLGQIEPIGVHPDYQGAGLSRALLFEMFRRFRDFGAETALVEPSNDRAPAISAYESVGFHIAHTVLRKGIWAMQGISIPMQE